MSIAHIGGFPRIGAARELKFALERFWQAPGARSEADLMRTGAALRARAWAWQRGQGMDYVAVGDFAWYDHVLATLALVGALPRRFGFDAARLTLPQEFAMARGGDGQSAMEMTKWFDTNYHYLVPEYSPGMSFGAGSDWLFEHIGQARDAGHPVKPVLIGPLTLLWLGKERDGLHDRLTLLPGLLDAYATLLSRLKAAGVEWVQIDEPLFAAHPEQKWLDAALAAYGRLGADAPCIVLATYFGDVSRHAGLLCALPVAGLHLDLARAPGQLDAFVERLRADMVLSAGIVDARNVWRHDMDASLAHLRGARQRLGDRLWLSASGSLLHVPVDLDSETRLDAELRGWLAFAVQKIGEVAALRQALVQGRDSVRDAFDAAARALHGRAASRRARDAGVRRRLAALGDAHERRAAPYPVRAGAQRQRFDLPLLPVTTIGSFPQTEDIRHARAVYRSGAMDHLAYLEKMRESVSATIRAQEVLGLDVLVHGEPERNDMVEYFAGHWCGFAVTGHGWVQSYGSRCVKPPIIYGDVYATEPVAVGWASYAQGLTDKPVKGMLTGPVTMLQWSFVRDDQPRESTAMQIALTLREEVAALEAAGIGMIQIDEPALREGLPLDPAARGAYLDWAVRAFRVASSGVANHTQIHTHMCYAEFEDILPAIAALDADVISIETARSRMALLDAFRDFDYPNEIGPGVWDIHSPGAPDVEEIAALIARAAAQLGAARLWVNPDCGLKTRSWPEVHAALGAMVAAARRVRATLDATVTPAA
jgi:5-methyltetrahydropteroyltriglutamate--homocysteine methyltransferase